MPSMKKTLQESICTDAVSTLAVGVGSVGLLQNRAIQVDPFHVF